MIELHTNEEILLEQRRHWYAIFSETFFVGIAAVLPLVFLFGGSFFESIRPLLGTILPLLIFGFSAWFLLLWIVFFVLWTNYYLDVLVVTNMRVIDIEQHGLFARDLVEVPFANIQDVKTEVLGVIPSLLNFGTLYIQTAGESKEVVIPHLPNADKVRHIISENWAKTRIQP